MTEGHRYSDIVKAGHELLKIFTEQSHWSKEDATSPNVQPDGEDGVDKSSDKVYGGMDELERHGWEYQGLDHSMRSYVRYTSTVTEESKAGFTYGHTGTHCADVTGKGEALPWILEKMWIEGDWNARDIISVAASPDSRATWDNRLDKEKCRVVQILSDSTALYLFRLKPDFPVSAREDCVIVSKLIDDQAQTAQIILRSVDDPLVPEDPNVERMTSHLVGWSFEKHPYPPEYNLPQSHTHNYSGSFPPNRSSLSLSSPTKTSPYPSFSQAPPSPSFPATHSSRRSTVSSSENLSLSTVCPVPLSPAAPSAHSGYGRPFSPQSTSNWSIHSGRSTPYSSFSSSISPSRKSSKHSSLKDMGIPQPRLRNASSFTSFSKFSLGTGGSTSPYRVWNGRERSVSMFAGNELSGENTQADEADDYLETHELEHQMEERSEYASEYGLPPKKPGYVATFIARIVPGGQIPQSHLRDVISVHTASLQHISDFLKTYGICPHLQSWGGRGSGFDLIHTRFMVTHPLYVTVFRLHEEVKGQETRIRFMGSTFCEGNFEVKVLRTTEWWIECDNPEKEDGQATAEISGVEIGEKVVANVGPYIQSSITFTNPRAKTESEKHPHMLGYLGLCTLVIKNTVVDEPIQVTIEGSTTWKQKVKFRKKKREYRPETGATVLQAAKTFVNLDMESKLDSRDTRRSLDTAREVFQQLSLITGGSSPVPSDSSNQSHSHYSPTPPEPRFHRLSSLEPESLIHRSPASRKISDTTSEEDSTPSSGKLSMTGEMISSIEELEECETAPHEINRKSS